MHPPERDGFEVSLNGEPRRVADPTSIAALLEQMELGGRRVAVAVNRQIVPRTTFAERWLAPGDRVEVLEAVGGGR